MGLALHAGAAFAGDTTDYELGYVITRTEYDRKIDDCGNVVYDRRAQGRIAPPKYKIDDWQFQSNASIEGIPVEKATGRVSAATGSIGLTGRQALHAESFQLSASYHDGSQFGCVASPIERLSRAKRIAERKLIIGDATRSQSGQFTYSYGPSTDQYQLSLSASREEASDSIRNRSITFIKNRQPSAIWAWSTGIGGGLEDGSADQFGSYFAQANSSYQLSRLTSSSISGRVEQRTNGGRVSNGSTGLTTALTRFNTLSLGISRTLIINSAQASSTVFTGTFGHKFSADTSAGFQALQTSYDDSAKSNGFWHTETLSHKITPNQAIAASHGQGNLAPQQSRGQSSYGVTYSYSLAQGASGGIRNSFGIETMISYNRDEATALSGDQTSVKRGSLAVRAKF